MRRQIPVKFAPRHSLAQNAARKTPQGMRAASRSPWRFPNAGLASLAVLANPDGVCPSTCALLVESSPSTWRPHVLRNRSLALVIVSNFMVALHSQSNSNGEISRRESRPTKRTLTAPPSSRDTHIAIPSLPAARPGNGCSGGRQVRLWARDALYRRPWAPQT